VTFHVSVYLLFNSSERSLYLAVILAIFFSHGVDESHQNAKTASHDNANKRRAHLIMPMEVSVYSLRVQLPLPLSRLRLVATLGHPSIQGSNSRHRVGCISM
jgi:hypothetical protein